MVYYTHYTYCRVRMPDVFGMTSDSQALALIPCPKPYINTPLSASGNNIPNAAGPTMKPRCDRTIQQYSPFLLCPALLSHTIRTIR